MEQEKKIERLEQKVKELEHELYSIRLEMRLMETKMMGYKLENMNMYFATQMKIKK